MVYNSQFVLCVLVNGHVQKELRNGTVKLPFGCEYGIRLRNKHNDRRAVVKIFVDGENVSGNGYIIPANDAIDIERHNDRDRAFKFVDLDSPEAVDAGKNGPNYDKEKGVIEARFYLERERKIYHPTTPRRRRKTDPRRSIRPVWISKGDASKDVWISKGDVSKDTYKSSTQDDQTSLLNFCSINPTVSSSDFVDFEDGCTVEGNATGQQFGCEYIDTETDFVSCRVFLQGYVSDEPVHVHVNKPSADVAYCDNCGTKRARKSSNFCHKCGAKL